MEVYVVYGIEYHVGRELLGIYNDFHLAMKLKTDEISKGDYDDVVVVAYSLNEPI